MGSDVKIMTAAELVLQAKLEHMEYLESLLSNSTPGGQGERRTKRRIAELNSSLENDPQLIHTFRKLPYVSDECISAKKDGKIKTTFTFGNGRTKWRLADAVYFDTMSGRYVFILMNDIVVKAPEQMFAKIGMDELSSGSVSG